MNAQETNFPIEDMSFSQPEQTQSAIISQYFSKEYKQNMKKRFFISIIVAVVIVIAEVIARLQARPDTISGMLLFVISGFLVYNIISYLYTRTKCSMDDILNRYECTYGTVSSKYDGHLLSKKSRENVPNYILFENEQGHCTTALPVKDSVNFHNISEGDHILIVKLSPLGKTSYQFIPLAKKEEL